MWFSILGWFIKAGGWLKEAFAWILKHNPIAWLFGAISAVLFFIVKMKSGKIEHQKEDITALEGEVQHAETQEYITEVAQESVTEAIKETAVIDQKKAEEIEKMKEGTDEETTANINDIINNFNRTSRN